MYANSHSNEIHSKMFIFSNEVFNQTQFNLKSKIDIIKKLKSQDLLQTFDNTKLVVYETNDKTFNFILELNFNESDICIPSI